MSFISIHGRTQHQRNDPVCVEAIRAVKDCVRIPVIANGGVRTLEEACALKEATGADGKYVCAFVCVCIFSIYLFIFFL